MDKKRKDNIVKFAGLLAFFGMRNSLELLEVIKRIDKTEYNKTVHFNFLDKEKLEIKLKDIKISLGLYIYYYEMGLENE
tara:strand:+ start:557 stop:793 length:237 start_codon:yes stop_codon:yes gene_type:complete